MALQTHPVHQADRISHEALAAASQGRQTKSSEDDVDSLNETLMIHSITDYGRHPYRYGIASVNFKGNVKGSRGSGNANLRKLLLSQLHGQTYNSIVFVQECPWNHPEGELKLEEKFCYTGVKNEAGVIWNSELFGVKRLDSYRLIGDKYPKLMQHRGRLCICEVTLVDQPVTTDNNVALEKTPNVSDFIAISWHGPHKCTDAEKQLVLRDLLEFVTVMYIKDKNGPKSCVIGGDFNFSIEKACEDLDSYPGLTIAASYGLETIDYFIFTSDLINILHADQLFLEYDAASIYTAQDRDRARAEECKAAPNDVIDHKPVFAVLDLGSPNPFSSPCKLKTRPKVETVTEDAESVMLENDSPDEGMLQQWTKVASNDTDTVGDKEKETQDKFPESEMVGQAGAGNDMSFLPLVREIIQEKDMESPDVNHKITELKTKFEKCRAMVEGMPGIDCCEEEQKQKIDQLRQQVTTKTDLLKKYKNLCAFELPR
ncbi:uncharacterized protein LOC144874604 isoform X2 [Branchiostoma floridae x Branchiostoma japonicum]